MNRRPAVLDTRIIYCGDRFDQLKKQKGEQQAPMRPDFLP